jgi:hypothetical protein
MWRLLVPILVLVCAIGSPIGLAASQSVFPCFMTSLVAGAIVMA